MGDRRPPRVGRRPSLDFRGVRVLATRGDDVGKRGWPGIHALETELSEDRTSASVERPGGLS
jgi:hypothetical protein